MIHKTILEAIWSAKNKLRQTAYSNPPVGTCKACGALKSVTWQSVDSERGFWTDDATCSNCANIADGERTRAHLRARFLASGVPPIHSHYTLRPQQQPCGRIPLPGCEHQGEARAAVESYRSPTWVCLAGSVGSGKTTILTALFCDLILKDRCSRTFLWHTEASLFKTADIAGDESHGKRMKVMKKASQADVLMIDDMAGNRRSLTEWQGGAIRDLIDERHRYERPTFFTTNLACWRHLEQRYGSHVISRMLEASTDLTVMDGYDLRLGGKNES